MKTYDLIVIGGGVLGTFHAYHASLKGYSVAILEKNKFAKGATTRNFGQVVPSGMNSKWQNYGRESLKIYKEIQEKFDISAKQNGSIYLASNEEEVQLLEELQVINQGNNYQSKLFTKKECLEKYPGLKESYVKAGLFFEEEITIEPRVMIHRIHEFLNTQSVDIFFNTKVLNCEEINGTVTVQSSDRRIFKSAKVIICNGSDFEFLYPDVFINSDLELSKLQMMMTKPQKNYQLKGSILTGLSIRRYEAFAECPSYIDIKTKENPNTLEKKYGVHILFKQANDGSIIIGDSHEYADARNKDELGYELNMDIDNFILQEAKEIFDLPHFEIQSRWFGIYSQSQNSDIFIHDVSDHIKIITGIGGKGMTGSAGFSKDIIANFM